MLLRTKLYDNCICVILIHANFIKYDSAYNIDINFTFKIESFNISLPVLV